MLGAPEFTFVGNVLMGAMAIGGVVGLIYGCGSYMTDMGRSEWKDAENTEIRHETIRKVA